jgi:hemoglobin
MRAHVAALLATCVAIAACSHHAPAPAPTGPKQPAGPVLYDRIGRMDAIKGIVKDFVEEGLKKGPLAARFANVDSARLEDSLANQLCELAGGPCKYTGRSMREVHAGMAITDAEFAAFETALGLTLVKFKVEPAEQRELIGLVREQRAAIVSQ